MPDETIFVHTLRVYIYLCFAYLRAYAPLYFTCLHAYCFTCLLGDLPLLNYVPTQLRTFAFLRLYVSTCICIMHAFVFLVPSCLYTVLLCKPLCLHASVFFTRTLLRVYVHTCLRSVFFTCLRASEFYGSMWLTPFEPVCLSFCMSRINHNLILVKTRHKFWVCACALLFFNSKVKA